MSGRELHAPTHEVQMRAADLCLELVAVTNRGDLWLVAIVAFLNFRLGRWGGFSDAFFLAGTAAGDSTSA